MEHNLNISWQTIFKILIAGFLLYALFLVRNMVVWFFFALIISILVEPAIVFMRRIRFPRVVSAILVYLFFIGAIGLMIYLVSPIFIFEINQLTRNIPEYIKDINPIFENLGVNLTRDFQETTADLVTILQDSSESIFRAVTLFFGGVVSTLFILVFAFYLSLEERGVENFLRLLSPKRYETHVMEIFKRAQFSVSGWFISRILACIFVGIVSFVVLLLLDVRYSFILALISGMLTFIPFVGPLVTMLLALLFIGVSQSWLVALYVVVAFTIIQQIENSFVTPLLMKKFLNLPPVLVLVSIMLGGALFGFLGMIFMVPIFGIVYEFSREFLKKRKEQEEFSAG